MAILATLAGVVFDVEVSCVDIRVAIYAFLPDFPKAPFSILKMALETRGRLVGSIQFELGLVVVGNGVKGHVKPIDRVAFSAIRPGDCRRGKLPFVEIGMAGSAIIVRQGIGQFFRMALLAVYDLVLSEQLEVGKVVVETLHFAIVPERFLVVAVSTVASEFIFVNILMTSGAIFREDTFPVFENG